MRSAMLAAAAAMLLLAVAARADINPADFDPKVKPQEDFYQYANGGWLRTHPIPPSYASYGTLNQVNDRNQDELHAILERAAKAERPSAIQRMVGDFYVSGMDLAAVNAAGIAPLRPELDALAALSRPQDVLGAIVRLHLLGTNVGFGFGSEQDPKDSSNVIAGAGQAGLGLPDRDYYLRTDARSARLRELYVAHVTRMFVLAGDTQAQAQGEARAVMALETDLARASKSNVALRDPVANYHKLPLAQVQALTPHFRWREYFSGIRLAAPAEVDIGQPEFFRAFDRLVAEAPAAEWRAYLRWHLLHEAAPYLSDPFVQENFGFFGRVLTGAVQPRERWQRVLATIDRSVGEAVGRLYVAQYFPPESKRRVLALVGDVRSALREDLSTLSWMDAPTRAAAVRKLDAMTVKIGYPDKWRDYSTLRIDRGPYVLNVLRADAFEVRRDLNKIGKPVDRTEWEMSPQTVNAYYDPLKNEIVFPAGILQPPLFDPKADDALNYGAIGAIIGHEMTHGFDDQGRLYDPQGNLRDWWTPESAKRFQALAAGIVRQFDAYVAVDDLHVNGELTQGENIADLGGVKLAYRALEKRLDGRPRKPIGGFTPEQRFFLAFAIDWRENERPEAIRLQVNTDPHAPDRFRTDGPLSNLPEFARAFDVPEGAPMRRPAAERVVIW